MNPDRSKDGHDRNRQQRGEKKDHQEGPGKTGGSREPPPITWEQYRKIKKLAFRCAEDDTKNGTSLDPHSMTPDDVEGIVPSKESAKRLIKFVGRQPGKTIREVFYGAYKQRLVELLKEGQANAGMCIEDDCRSPVKRLGGHTFRRCPHHMNVQLREQST